ncbi:hypothetical protein B0H19DRAFT_1145839 [Mycena capillaripes]|nr:hypothetical protein B0H19DRAFT_1145839 [Mycena capillaripes]
MSTQAALDPPPDLLFPPELMEIIISNVGDEATLRVCSLVCRAWLPTTRHQLHHRLFLAGEKILRFLDLLLSPHNTYVDVVQTIKIVGAENAPVLLARLPEFSHLQTIEIKGIDFPYQFSALPAVLSLTLYSKFPSFYAFTQFLTRFPGLKTLILGSITFDGESSPSVESTALLAPLQLDRLSLVASWFENDRVRAWLASETVGLVTRDLTLRFCTVESQTANAISQFIHRLGAHLKHLHLLDLVRSHVPSYPVEEVDLGPSTALRTLHISRAIDFCLYLDPPNPLPDGDSLLNYPAWDLHISPRLIPLLKRFTSNSLESLIFDVKVVDLRFAPREPSSLGAFIGIFERSGPYTGITKLEFRAAWENRRKHPYRETFESMVVQRLPPSIARVAVLVAN